VGKGEGRKRNAAGWTRPEEEVSFNTQDGKYACLNKGAKKEGDGGFLLFLRRKVLAKRTTDAVELTCILRSWRVGRRRVTQGYFKCGGEQACTRTREYAGRKKATCLEIR